MVILSHFKVLNQFVSGLPIQRIDHPVAGKLKPIEKPTKVMTLSPKSIMVAQKWSESSNSGDKNYPN